MSSITVVVGEPPYGKERVYSTLRFILAAISEGHLVNLFILEDAVFLAKRGQDPPEFPGLMEEHMPNCEELLKAAIKQGLKVKACGVCSQERALKKDELIDGVEIAGMRDLVKWVVDSDKTLFF